MKETTADVPYTRSKHRTVDKLVEVQPNQATSDYAHDNCNRTDVAACKYHSDKCVLLRAGGTVQLEHPAGTPLWPEGII